MLAEVLDAAAVARAQESQQQQQPQEGSRSSVAPSSLACVSPPSHLTPLNLSAVQSDTSTFSSAKSEDESGVLARKAAARSVCSSLAPFEQDLCLLLAAFLRHARHASLDDPRLQVRAASVDAVWQLGSFTRCSWR
jgi:hypothetical protein